MTQTTRRLFPHTQRYLMAGVLTVIPLAVTWVLFEFILEQLSHFGLPWAKAFTQMVDKHYPGAATWLLEPWFQNVLAVVVTLLALYLLGWLATQVIGKRLIGMIEAVIERIPFVQSIYGALKKLVAVLQTQPESGQRVVLIAFPSPEMKTVGLVTRTFTDAHTGQKLAAVYVPTTPNPTSGYLEIIPVERLVATDWSMDEAMTFIMSGGAVAPEEISYEGKPSDAGR